MNNEVKVNKANKSLSFINNGIAYSQFGIPDEILDLITNLQEENERLKNENFKLDYQNIRIKGALFEFEMNYYQDNLKGTAVV